MKWAIPAKTFLLGEYAALAKAPALLVTTTPSFELKLQDPVEFTAIHPDSPAGLLWQKQQYLSHTLSWSDPYHGMGGLGASSAQFIGCYLACCALSNKTPNLSELMHEYYQCAWNGSGLQPSGYDVLAQTQSGCVYINKKKQQILTYDWPFRDLSFLLVHTGKKLATHHHLQQAQLPQCIDRLAQLVDTAHKAFELKHSELLIECINNYHNQLKELNLIAPHTVELIDSLTKYPEILAIKGCGALGADIILIITSREQALSVQNKLKEYEKIIVATEDNVATNALFSNELCLKNEKHLQKT